MTRTERKAATENIENTFRRENDRVEAYLFYGQVDRAQYHRLMRQNKTERRRALLRLADTV